VRILILGTNLRGLAHAARISLDEGAEVLMYDAEVNEPPPDLANRVTVLPTRWRSEYLVGVDRVITSPWFPQTEPPISDVMSQGVDVITEAGFGLEHTDVPFVGITGTNGKTTVTELVTAMLAASGVRGVAAGNLGEPVSGLVGLDTDIDADLLVLELSSYQLRFLGDAIPIGAALLNIAPDHLDWHGTFDEYVAAKSRIFRDMAHDSILAYNVDDETVVGVVAGARCTLVPCSGIGMPQGGNGVASECIVINDHEFPTPTSDPSFLLDLVVAGTLAEAVGAHADGIGSTIAGFAPGAHRRQLVETSDGIVWINDSKATNPHATSAAVAAHAPVVLLAGGQNKGLDLSIIGNLDGVTNLIAFGEAGAMIGRHSSAEVMIVDSLEDAVTHARSVASAGDTVLLSPGCASFDEFSSYAERGDEFRRLVTRTEETAA
jgi:UDP-N-acetylmuramoylalanine--D-glutamate ligase